LVGGEVWEGGQAAGIYGGAPCGAGINAVWTKAIRLAMVLIGRTGGGTSGFMRLSRGALYDSGTSIA
jgi:hypothetical protein